MGTSRKIDLLQGTVDLIVLKLLRAGAAHGWALTQSIQDGHARRARCQLRNHLSGAPAPGGEWMGTGVVGCLREQPSRALL